MQSPEQVNRQVNRRGRVGGILLTGFLGFEGFDVNPSALLAQSSGRDFELIEVSYRAVDAFLDSLDPNRFDKLLLLGVAGKSSRLRLETTAKNIIGERGDVRSEASPGPIDPAGPNEICGTLWTPAMLVILNLHRRPSDDAGDYLCNYIYYRALRKFENAGKRIGFLHVAPISQMSLDSQQIELAKILDEIA